MQTPYADDAGILLQMKGKLTIGKVKSLHVLLIFQSFIPYYSTLIIVGIFSASVFPLLRAMMSRLCTPDEQGKN
jgi:hypothetical protein